MNDLGKNKVEHFIFILMICTSMVFIMSCYNIALMEGLSFNVLKHAVLGFIPAFLFALVGDIFIVGQIVKKIMPKIINPTDTVKKKAICMAFFMGCGMVLWMSFYGAVVNVGFNEHLLWAYGSNIVKNFVFAIPLNLLIVSPSARTIFFKLFPPENLNTKSTSLKI